MGLAIYERADPSSAFSQDQSFTNPMSCTFDGITGGVLESCFYIRNNNAARSYSDIQLTATGSGLVDGASGYSWKLYVGDQQPLEAQWALVSPGNTISLSNLEDTTTYLPFWLRIEIPKGAPIKSYQSVALETQAMETIIP